MILQERSESIVMLTCLVENQMKKCHEYFPKQKKSVQFGNITVTGKSEKTYPTHIKRILKVEKVR